MALYELVYTSVSNFHFTYEGVIDILKSCMKNNPSLGITGILVVNGREIIQVLEGEEENVKKLFSKIEKDERHTSVQVFWENAIEERGFGKWTMAYTNLKEIEGVRLMEYQEYIDGGLNKIKNTTTAKTLLHTLRDYYLPKEAI